MESHLPWRRRNSKESSQTRVAATPFEIRGCDQRTNEWRMAVAKALAEQDDEGMDRKQEQAGLRPPQDDFLLATRKRVLYICAVESIGDAWGGLSMAQRLAKSQRTADRLLDAGRSIYRDRLATAVERRIKCGSHSRRHFRRASARGERHRHNIGGLGWTGLDGCSSVQLGETKPWRQVGRELEMGMGHIPYFGSKN